MKLTSNSPAETILIGRALGRLLPPGSVVCVQGGLGAGKTHLAKGVALGLGVTEHVTSPTFTLINEYEGRLPLYHVDVYRLDDDREAYELGLEEYLDGQGVTIIEWPERVLGLLPDEYLTVVIDYPETDEQARKLEFTARGRRYNILVEKLKLLLKDELKPVLPEELNANVRAGD